MKSQLNKKQVQELKQSAQHLKKAQKPNFQSRHKLEQDHFYLKEDLSPSLTGVKLESRRKK
jgi:hypothetical protein